MLNESLNDTDRMPFLPAPLEPENQSELIRLLRERGNTQDPDVQALLQAWITALDAANVSAPHGCLLQAQLYERAGMVEKAVDQLRLILEILDQCDRGNPNVTEADRAIGNAAIEMGQRLQGNRGL